MIPLVRRRLSPYYGASTLYYSYIQLLSWNLVYSSQKSEHYILSIRLCEAQQQCQWGLFMANVDAKNNW